MKRILFVCTGNTCRSPMAQALMEKEIKQRNQENNICCDSAGIAADEGCPPSENAVAVMAEYGCDISKRKAKQLTLSMIGEADEIYTMTESHKGIIEAMSQDTKGKIFVLNPAVSDPFGGSLEEYRKCARIIENAIKEINVINEK